MAARGLPRKAGQAVHHEIVDEAVRPLLVGLERLDGRVPGLVEVLGRVLVRRVVAAADVTANHAEPEVDPLVSRLEAFLAASAARLDRVAARSGELLQMRTDFCHGDLLETHRTTCAIIPQGGSIVAPRQEAAHG